MEILLLRKYKKLNKPSNKQTNTPNTNLEPIKETINEILLKYYEVTNINKININSKIGFFKYCLDNLENIKKIKLPDTCQKIKPVNCVLIEFRNHPHIEFIIRNNIIKLGNKVNFTIVCGKNNYQMIKNFNINNLTIIKQNINNVTRGEYSKLLASSDFWKQFENEYILINQSDSIIFNDNLDDFIGYDYIGSPWLKPTRPSQLFMGNGGFSLRKKDTMIKICNKYKIENMPNYMKPVKFMSDDDNNICPEDVYFCQYLLRLSNVNLPSYDTCVNFSLESFISNNPFGGHDFFKHKWIKFIEKNPHKIPTIIPKITPTEILENIKICKIPNVNEFIVINNEKVYQNKYLNSDIGKKYITKYQNNEIDLTYKKIINFNKVLLYSNRWDFNWRHFLIETFYNLKDAFNNQEITILICKTAPKHIYELFTILNIQNYYEIDDNTLIQANQLVIPSKNDTLKNVFLKKVIDQSTKIAINEMINPYNKIYLTRNNNNKNYRYVSNQEKLNNILMNNNFVFIRGGTIPLYHQIYLINQATEIITQIGANCDNIIFSNNKSKFKIIYPLNCKRWAKMYNMYSQCVLLYCGDNVTKNTNNDKLNWNYTLDFSKFKI